jgi:hypothetical protein
MKSFVTQRTTLFIGHAPLAMSWINPIGPSTFPSKPTAAISKPRSGSRTTCQ